MADSKLDLSGKTVLITGGSRGLGKAIALAMAGQGAKIAVCGRKQEALDEALKEFKEAGFDAMGYRADVGKSDQVKALFEAVIDRCGGWTSS